MAQCSNCQFHNLPGAANCGRCGTSLLLAGATEINVHPPRASRGAKFLRRFRLRTLWCRLRNLPREWAGVFRRPRYLNRRPSPVDFLRLVIPGWWQWSLGWQTMGSLLIAGWATAVMATIVLAGTFAGSVALGMVIAIHIASLYGVASLRDAERFENVMVTAVWSGIIAIVMYLPLYQLVTRHALPIVVHQTFGPIQAGDVVLCQSSAQPHRADLVVYDSPRFNVPRPGRIIRVQGRRINRILAEAGQTVEQRDGKLIIDGIAGGPGPINVVSVADFGPVTVPVDHVFILPSVDIGYLGPDAMTIKHCFVPITNIQGRLYWRSWPWSRLGRIH